MSPLIINLAPTGVRPTKAQNPAVLLTHDKIVADACEALELGASMVHLHVRDAAAPDMASLTLSSLNFTTGASVNSPETVDAFARTMRDQGPGRRER